MAAAVGWDDEDPRVLVVEDDERLRSGISAALRRLGFAVVEAASCESAAAALSSRPDAVITDLRLPDGDALNLLPRVKAFDASIPIFVVTGHATIDLAVKAVKQGAEDFLAKPVDLGALVGMVKKAIERRTARRSGARPRLSSDALATRSQAMLRVEDQVTRLRDADCTVLLLGETGTGKTVLARRIHQVGLRSGGPFVDINCAGLTKELVESELFGHERGAFTGAHVAKQGLLDAANGGSIFLDEIGDIDVQVQPKLLKVLEEKRFRRVGDVRDRTVDIRLIAATHHDLLQNVARSSFRADLYYRISTVTITIPPLRDRKEDLLRLAHHMLQDLGAPSVELAPDARQSLLDHAWPGNLRELRNVLERALMSHSDDVIRASELRFDRTKRPSVAPLGASARPRTGSSRTLSEVEREHIRSALLAEGGRVEAAARRLGIPRSTLYQRIKAHGIDTRDLRRASTIVSRSDK